MTILASASGVVIFEDGQKIFISKTPAPRLNTFLFITALLTIILLFNGILQTFIIRETNRSSAVGIVLLVIGAICAIVFWRAIVYKKRKAALPLNKLEKIVVFDLKNDNLLDGQQQIISPLHLVYMTRKMQFTSSSPELMLEWAGGSLSLVKGDPFSGGVSAIEIFLLSKGIRKRG